MAPNIDSLWTGRGIQEGRKRESEKNERERERHLISIFGRFSTAR
jgi:hypothetical protein